MFGIPTSLLIVVVCAVCIVGLALYARRPANAATQDAILKMLPDAGDRLWLEVQAKLPTKADVTSGSADLRDKVRAKLDELDAAENAMMIATLAKRGITVSPPAASTSG